MLTAVSRSEQTRQTLVRVEQLYQAGQRPERPHSRLAQARHERRVAAERQLRARQQLAQAQHRLAQSQCHLTEARAQHGLLLTRLNQFETDNAANPRPVPIVIRLDAGFGSYDNLALLIEMGYEVYTKPYSHQVAQALQPLVGATPWTRVGANAEMIAWTNHSLKGCPYPLDVALERFYTGDTCRYGVLLHFGADPVCRNLPAWFATYNCRQTQEQMVLFAANFIRWARHSLLLSTEPSMALCPTQWGLKKLVHIAAHTSAEVSQDKDGLVLKFTPQSVFAGKSLKMTGYCLQLPLPFFKTCSFMPVSMSPPLIAQNLG